MSWYLLSLVGKDRPGIVAKLSAGLCKNGCNLGDSSMARLGDNFAIMLAVQFDGSQEALGNVVAPLAGSLNLNQHLMKIEQGTHHIEPDVRINLFAEDRMGIIEDVTSALAETGLNILTLESNLDDHPESNTYSIHIEGTVSNGLSPLYKVLDVLAEEKSIQSQLIPINAQVA
ncbi:amino acid-binding ACT [Candidatus Nitromaritima sp. SCGC AAA799-A02]|nr:amino acid-binding ACT [Candidatus Nitromaritima sp. SCGC AAA799-C22]KMP11619.1 amino acid-binding ACT [Candidatus Nitromaritima sp. SCGC AAA799-A02]